MKIFGRILLAAIAFMLAVVANRVFFPPFSELMIVNAASAPIRSGELRIGRDKYELGSLAPGARRVFRHRLNGPEGDFGVKASFDGRIVSQEAFGYIDGIPWVSDQQFNVIEINDRTVRVVSTKFGNKSGS